MPFTLPASPLSSPDGYRLWSQTYDTDLNPMLSLEARLLKRLLPPTAGLDILDLGCGTGRWLSALEHTRPRSLRGVDSSQEMLQVARAKLGNAAELLQENVGQCSLPAACSDLLISSFVLSYIEHPDELFFHVKRLLRPGGTAFLTDLHPETAAKLNWQRGVHLPDGFQQIQTFPHTLDSVLRSCAQAGLSIAACLQAPFAEPEQIIFNSAGKAAYFEKIRSYPAIYLLQLDLAPALVKNPSLAADPISTTAINGARFVLDAYSAIPATLTHANSRITTIRDDAPLAASTPSSGASLDLAGYLLFPGLINAHDHLEFALFPRLGRGDYRNFTEWASDIYHPENSPVREHRLVPRDVRLWWGGIRNLLAGVTMVSHHNAYEPLVFEDDFIIHVLREYGWAHSLAIDTEFAKKKCATPPDAPFLLHLAEGIDAAAEAEIHQLHESGALDERTVVVHGLGLQEAGRALLRQHRAGLVWCPSSNDFLFGKTPSSDELRQLPLVALGSDSPLTATGDLLDELQFAQRATACSAPELFHQVTENAATLLRLPPRAGTIAVDGRVDLFAIRDSGANPADALLAASYENIELVLINGRVQLASELFMNRLPAALTTGLQPLRIESSLRWIRAPLERLFQEAEAHLGKEFRLGGKRVSRAL